VLVAGHAPFCWGRTADEAAHIAVVLEEVAGMALQTIAINPAASCLVTEQHDKHYFRKHGAGAYYGQLKDPKAAK
jgi:L-ribulose-5-phosphate 4-epimerase